MKLLSLLIVTLLVAGLALAQQPAKGGAKTHSVAGEVVSADTNAKTITVKQEKGENFTAPVDPSVAAELANLKAGDKVTLTCRDNDKGEHLIVQITKQKAAAGG
jgi:Cu/Ag efflux protein CusF